MLKDHGDLKLAIEGTPTTSARRPATRRCPKSAPRPFGSTWSTDTRSMALASRPKGSAPRNPSRERHAEGRQNNRRVDLVKMSWSAVALTQLG